ncbi:MAG TPA: hypothetical protein VFI11_00215 [Anaerolineales bacterium]|nr:hypothetical protein [Anaerolineales bacterium]
MIRKLKPGMYRLYSKKKDAKTGKRRNLGTFRTRTGLEARTRDSVLQASLTAASLFIVYDFAPQLFGGRSFMFGQGGGACGEAAFVIFMARMG